MYSDNKSNKGNSNSEHSFMKMVHNHQHFVKFFILSFQARVKKKRLKLSTWGMGGEEGSSYDGLYGEPPLERDIFLRLHVYERVGISLVDKKGNLSLGYVKVPKRANR